MDLKLIPPTRIFIKLTNFCNFHCKMCPQWRNRQAFNTSGKEATFLSQKLASSVKTSLERWNSHITFWGGEPLMHPQLETILNIFASLSGAKRIITNGYFLENEAELLIECGITHVQVSVDGPPKTHNNIRGCKDAYKRILKGVRLLKHLVSKNRKRKVQIDLLFTLTVRNQDVIAKLPSIQREFDADNLIINLPMFTPPTVGSQYERIMLQEFGCKADSWRDWGSSYYRLGSVNYLQSQIEELVKMNGCIVFPWEDNDTLSKWCYTLLPLNNQRKCSVPWRQISIEPNGDVLFCMDWPDYVIGSLNENSLEDIWSGIKANRFRKYLLKLGLLPICPRCCHLYSTLSAQETLNVLENLKSTRKFLTKR